MSGGRIILVTGSTDGLGRRVAEMLAGSGHHILVHGRNTARGSAVVDSVRRSGGSATFYQADLSALSEIRRLADAVLADHAHLDVLVNNAGIAKIRDPRRESPDGVECHFAVNYLAPFLLTDLLRPLLGAEAPSRIVNVVSAGQSPIDFADPMLERDYDGFRAYAQSKLAQVMLTFDLAEQFAGTGVAANCLHPATCMDTAMVREAGLRPSNAVETGAEAVVALLAGGDSVGPSGRYFDGRSETRAHAQAYDGKARARLRAISRDLVSRAA